MKNPVTGASIDVFGPTHKRLFAAFAQRGRVPESIDNGMSTVLAERVAENPNLGIDLVEGKLTDKLGKAIWTIRKGVSKRWPSGGNGLRLTQEDKEVLREAIYQKVTMAQGKSSFMDDDSEYSDSVSSSYLAPDARAFYAKQSKASLAKLPIGTKGMKTHYAPDPKIRAGPGVPAVYIRAITENVEHAMEAAGRLIDEAAADALDDAVFILYKMKSNSVLPYKVEDAGENHYRAGINAKYPGEYLVHSRAIATRLIVRAMCAQMEGGCGNANAVNSYVEKYLLPEHSAEFTQQHQAYVARLRAINGLRPVRAKSVAAAKSGARASAMKSVMADPEMARASASEKYASARASAADKSMAANGDFASLSPIYDDYGNYRTNPFLGEAKKSQHIDPFMGLREDPFATVGGYQTTGLIGQSRAPVMASAMKPSMSPRRRASAERKSMSPSMSPRRMSGESMSPSMSRRASAERMSAERKSMSPSMSPRRTSPALSRRMSGESMAPSMNARTSATSPSVSRRMSAERMSPSVSRRMSAERMSAEAMSPRTSGGYKDAVSRYAGSRVYPDEE